jgi:hypothetical protein
VAGLIAVRWLPRGLVVAGIPTAGLAVFHALMSLGNRSTLARRLALGGATAGAIGVLAAFPIGGPPILRAGLVALAVVCAWTAWKAGPTADIGEAPLVLARGLVFSGGVLLPVAWWAPEVFREFLRAEHVLLMMLAIVGASCRSEWRQRSPARPRLTGWAAAAFLLTLLSGFSLLREPSSPARVLFLGIALGSLLLAAGILLAGRHPLSSPWKRLVPDLAWLGFPLVGFLASSPHPASSLAAALRLPLALP